MALSSLLVVGGAASPAAADGGLSISTEITYTFDPAAPAVRGQHVIRLTNTVPDRREGNVINRAYFTGYTLSLPRGAQNVTATANGSPTTITVEPHSSDEFLVADVEFSRNLFYRSTETLDVRFDLLGSVPRSDDAARVNAAYAAFEVFGYADPGQLDVTVVMPDTYEIERFGDQMLEESGPGTTTLSALDIAEPETFYTFISIRDDDRLTSGTVRTSGATFDVRAWPGDTTWERFVRRAVKRGVPALEEAIGQPWPLTGTVEVREAYTPYFYGYAGWFNATTKELEVGEDLDRELVVHELSHAWFNRDTYGERWMSEGLAQTYAAMVVERIGGKADRAKEPRRSRFDLLDWGAPSFSMQSDSVRADERFGYDASWWVVQGLVDEVGEDRMREIFAAIDADEMAYVGEGSPETQYSSSAIDWRRLLDLAEERGEAEDFVDLVGEWVAGDERADDLADRAAARESYAELAEVSGDWAMPFGIRRAMGNWAFPRAETLMDAAHDIIDAHDELVAATAVIEVQPTDDYETVYEAATDVDELDLVERMEADTAAAERVAEVIAAEAEDDGFFGNLGLRDEDLQTPLAEAREAVAAGDPETAVARADEVQALIDGAEQEGKDIVTRWAVIAGSVLLGLLVLLTVLLVLRRRRRRRRAAADAASPAGTADDAPAAVPAVVDAPTPAGTDDDRSAADWVDRELATPAPGTEAAITEAEITEPHLTGPSPDDPGSDDPGSTTS